jgi:hypothetical protein
MPRSRKVNENVQGAQRVQWKETRRGGGETQVLLRTTTVRNKKTRGRVRTREEFEAFRDALDIQPQEVYDFSNLNQEEALENLRNLEVPKSGGVVGIFVI